MEDEELLLYSRQILMPSMGVDGQQQLLDSTVVIVGAGGLGCTVTQYLLGSGVGSLIIIDDDEVELSNLPRQIVFDMSDIGRPKAKVLCDKSNRRLPQQPCQAIVEKFSTSLFGDIVQRVNTSSLLVVDAGDNLSLSYQLDAVVTDFQLPLVHASVSKVEGYVYVRLPQDGFPSLKSVFSQQSSAESCSQHGVMTAAVGLIGSYQAMQVVRVLLQPRFGDVFPELMLFDGTSMRFVPLSLVSEKD